jgi:DNA-binding Lrp family transcriptional regulator
MSVTAYVLIQTEVGRPKQVAQAIRQINGVLEAHNVLGPYDVVVTVTAATNDDLGKLVSDGIQQVDGIARTFTCPVIDLT